MKKSWLKLINNDQGASLIEAMVGVALIAVAAVTVTQFSGLRRVQTSSNLTNSCNRTAKSVVDYIKEISMSANRSSYYLGTSGDPFENYDLAATLGGKVNDTANDPWIGTSDAATPFFDNPSATNFVTNTYLLNSSSIRALTTIFNENPGNVCETFSAYAPLTSQITNQDLAIASGGNIAPTVSIKVTPYNILDKQPVANCNTLRPLYIRPAGNPTHIGSLAGANISHWNRSRDDLGMRLQVQVQYTDKDGDPMSCQTSHDFQYPKDINQPRISFFQVSNLTYNAGSPQNPNSLSETAPFNADANITLSLGVDNADLEEGISFLCRDSFETVDFNHTLNLPSIVANPNVVTPANVMPESPVAPNNYACITSGIETQPANHGTVFRYGLPLGTAPATAEVGPTPANLVSTSSNDWVPCHQMTLCGQNQIAGSFRVNTDPGSLDRGGDQTERVLLTMSYTIPQAAINNLQFCRLGTIQAAVVDSAGNFSAPVTLEPPTAGGAIRNAPTAAGTRMLDVTLNEVDVDGTFTGATLNYDFSNYFEPTTTVGIAPAHCAAGSTLCDPATVPPPVVNGPSDEWHPNWLTRFPDGYYTNRAGGCCVDPSPTNAGTNGLYNDNCHPWSN